MCAPRYELLGSEGFSSARSRCRSRPLNPGENQFRHVITVALNHHHVAVTAHTAISQEPEIGLGAIFVQRVGNAHVELARMVDIIRADQDQRALATIFGEICNFHLRPADVETLLQKPRRDWLQGGSVTRGMLARKLRALAD